MKKILGIFMIMMVLITTPLINVVVATTAQPSVSIYPPSSGVVEVGGSVSYTVVARNATSFEMSASDIAFAKGISANISIQTVSSTEKVITLSNIQGNIGAAGYFAIRAGVAKNGSLSSKASPASPSFTIIQAQVTPDPTPTPTPDPTPEPTPTPDPDDNNNSGGENVSTPGEDNPSGEGGEEGNEPVADTEAPRLSISKVSSSSVYAGGEVSYTIDYTDNEEIESISLDREDIILYGFTADVTITADGNSRKVTLSNISGSLGGMKFIKILSGTAIDKAGNTIKEDTNSGYFKLIDDSTKNKPDDWIENPNTGK